MIATATPGISLTSIHQPGWGRWHTVQMALTGVCHLNMNICVAGACLCHSWHHKHLNVWRFSCLGVHTFTTLKRIQTDVQSEFIRIKTHFYHKTFHDYQSRQTVLLATVLHAPNQKITSNQFHYYVYVSVRIEYMNLKK